jgi:hypothetical protein
MSIKQRSALTAIGLCVLLSISACRGEHMKGSHLNSDPIIEKPHWETTSASKIRGLVTGKELKEDIFKLANELSDFEKRMIENMKDTDISGQLYWSEKYTAVWVDMNPYSSITIFENNESGRTPIFYKQAGKSIHSVKTLSTYDPKLILLEVEWSGGSGSFSNKFAEILRMQDHTVSSVWYEEIYNLGSHPDQKTGEFIFDTFTSSHAFHLSNEFPSESNNGAYIKFFPVQMTIREINDKVISRKEVKLKSRLFLWDLKKEVFVEKTP